MPGEIQLDELTKSFDGDVVAVDGIDLHMPAGEFFTMVGPSGCGKTTTLRMIAGFEQPTSGQILLDGVDMAQVPPHKRNVNTVFQSYALFPHLDVAANVGVRPQVPALHEGGAAATGGGGARGRPAHRVRAAQARTAVRRPAAADRSGARARPESARAPARRAARRARRAPAQEPPGGAQGVAGRARDHLRVRHARSGGGADDERPPGDHERREGRAGRIAEGRVRGSGDGLRGQLPRRLEPDAGGGGRP